jgi:hypothetical protein
MIDILELVGIWVWLFAIVGLLINSHNREWYGSKQKK